MYTSHIKAKEIFLKYSGNHFPMELEDEDTLYKEYKISKDQENIG